MKTKRFIMKNLLFAMILALLVLSCEEGKGPGGTANVELLISISSANLAVGGTRTLQVTVLPVDAANQTEVVWSSGDPGIVSIAPSGKSCVITAVTPGSTVVSVSLPDGSKTATCNITVTGSVIRVASIEFENEKETISAGRSFTLNTIILPENAANKTLNWVSSDETVATVEGGIVRGLSAGEVTITATSTDGSGVRAVCEITVGSQRVIVAYASWWTNNAPAIDPFTITHLNWAFGTPTMTGSGSSRRPTGAVSVSGAANLRNVILPLRDVNPDLKVLLCIGGYATPGFSQIARDEELRLLFAADVKRVIDEYGLDGVDINWEYPTRTDTDSLSILADTQNSTLLFRDIRAAIGPDKLLTIACPAGLSTSHSPNGARDFYEYEKIEPYLDWINIMTYDLTNGPPGGHNSPLFKSTRVPWESSEIGVNNHIGRGFPPHKIVMGMAIYGRCDIRVYNDRTPSNPDTYVGNFNVLRPHNPDNPHAAWVNNPNFRYEWDDVAKASMLFSIAAFTSVTGANVPANTWVLSFECERSVEHKVQFIKDRGLLGAMYWEIYQDDRPGVVTPEGFSLTRAIYREMFKKDS